ncbi:MAG TPA: bifunctional demethylmenaquinone methyltransferase/2-methoxy-6-polyprenyl-1,4-benzoquinol methylase UbiE [Chitinophagaceae bacterium]|nr:bifunctional demethylmenaquinone methyltransferase/2-methoxy-6-polyprenyl-1,4-benzoquinol methylase UbiE [Chitinophagaceae bacterium]
MSLSKLPHDPITPYGDAGTAKKEQVAQMFNRIARRYDFLNRLLSAGIDRTWRRRAVDLLKHEPHDRILDVASGTADMAILAARRLGTRQITGIDISEQMLELGRKKVEKEGFANVITLQTGDSETINFPSGTFDAVLVAFGVRNFENLHAGLQEMLRVLKPGGRLVVLEFSKPRNALARGLYNLYMGALAPELAGWFSRDKKAYQYLNKSALAFPDRGDFVDILNRVGYLDTSYKPLSLGICCIYSGRKPVSP